MNDENPNPLNLDDGEEPEESRHHVYIDIDADGNVTADINCPPFLLYAVVGMLEFNANSMMAQDALRSAQEAAASGIVPARTLPQ